MPYNTMSIMKSLLTFTFAMFASSDVDMQDRQEMVDQGDIIEESGLASLEAVESAESTEPLRENIANDDAEAQYRLADRYHKGEGVAQNYEQAVYWYRKAADQGHAAAQFCLGSCYYCGIGVAVDYKQSVYWLRKAAEQGHDSAQYWLGWIYQNGDGVAQDIEQAVYWYCKAADQGHVYAKSALEDISHSLEHAREEERKRKAAARREFKRNLGMLHQFFVAGQRRNAKEGNVFWNSGANNTYFLNGDELGLATAESIKLGRDCNCKAVVKQVVNGGVIVGCVEEIQRVGYYFLVDDETKYTTYRFPNKIFVKTDELFAEGDLFDVEFLKYVGITMLTDVNGARVTLHTFEPCQVPDAIESY